MLVHKFKFGTEDLVPLFGGYKKVPARCLYNFVFIEHPEPLARKIKQRLYVIDTETISDHVYVYAATIPTVDIDWNVHQSLPRIDYDTCLSYPVCHVYGERAQIRDIQIKPVRSVNTFCSCCGHPFKEGDRVIKLELFKSSGFNYIKGLYKVTKTNITIHAYPSLCNAGGQFILDTIRKRSSH